MNKKKPRPMTANEARKYLQKKYGTDWPQKVIKRIFELHNNPFCGCVKEYRSDMAKVLLILGEDKS